MSYQHKPNSGSIFKNDKREKETHPQMKGDALIDGVEYWISAWTNSKNDGEKYQGLKFERKDKQAYTPQQNAQVQQEAGKASGGERPQEPDFDDSLPF